MPQRAAVLIPAFICCAFSVEQFFSGIATKRCEPLASIIEERS